MGKDDWLEDEFLYGGVIEMSRIEYKVLKKIENRYIRIDNDLTEYMGFSDDHLRSDKWLMRYNKKDLIEKIHKQRDVIRKVIDDLEPEKRQRYLDDLKRIENDY